MDGEGRNNEKEFDFRAVSSEVIDLASITRVKFSVVGGHDIVMELNEDNSAIMNHDSGSSLIVTYEGMEIPVVLASENYATLFFYCNKYNGITGYISYVEYGEIVHQINPKFIPGYCLTVLDLTDIIIDGEGTALTAQHYATLIDLATKRRPFIVYAKVKNADYIDIISGVPNVDFWGDGSEVEVAASIEVKHIYGRVSFTLFIMATNEGAAAIFINSEMTA